MKDTRPFCKTLPYDADFYKKWADMPKMEIWYTPRGKCLMYVNGVEIGKLPHHKTDNQHECTRA